jgi:aminoglycoside phosphotransferase (APT) family kinase protein
VADRTAGPTVAALRRLTHESVELDQLSTDEQRQLRQLLPWWEGRVAELAATMPATLGHGDLHTGNYVVGPSGVVIFDWTDAATTFPGLDAVLLATSAGPERRQATLTAYADTWRTARPDADVARALELAPLVLPGYQAISYEGIYRAAERRASGELGGLVARNLRALVDRWRDADSPNY